MLSLRNQVLRQEGVNSVLIRGGRESIDYVSSPLTKGGEREYFTSTPTLQMMAREGIFYD